MKTILKHQTSKNPTVCKKEIIAFFQGSKLVALDRLIRLKSEQIMGLSGVERVLEFFRG